MRATKINRSFIMALSGLCLAVCFSASQAVPYTFTKIADGKVTSASLNNLGEVAYLTNSKLFISDGLVTTSISDIAEAAGQFPSRPPRFHGPIVVNDFGTILYPCYPENGPPMCRVNRDGSVSSNIPVIPNGVSMNNAGEVPFALQNTIRVANPVSGVRTIFDGVVADHNIDLLISGGFPDAPAINDQGEVLFSAAFRDDLLSAYFVTDGQALRQVTPEITTNNSTHAFGINNRGTVTTTTFANGQFVSLDLVFKDLTVETLVDSSMFDNFTPTGINDLDEVLFYGREKGAGGRSGLFKASVIGIEYLIGHGDGLSLEEIFPDSLNNLGQFIFGATTENGVALYRADIEQPNPVPEPTTLALISIGLFGLNCSTKRTQTPRAERSR